MYNSIVVCWSLRGEEGDDLVMERSTDIWVKIRRCHLQRQLWGIVARHGDIHGCKREWMIEEKDIMVVGTSAGLVHQAVLWQWLLRTYTISFAWLEQEQTILSAACRLSHPCAMSKSSLAKLQRRQLHRLQVGFSNSACVEMAVRPWTSRAGIAFIYISSCHLLFDVIYLPVSEFEIERCFGSLCNHSSWQY